MMGKIRIWIVFVLAVSISLSLYFLVFKQTENSIFVTVDNNLSSSKVRVERGFYSINSDSDAELLAFGLKEKVYVDNQVIFFEKRCGENDFLVVYDNKYYVIIRHFILNDFYDGIPEAYSYHFDFKKKGDVIRLILRVEGEFSQQFEKDLVAVERASHFLWGRPLENIIEKTE